MGRARAVLGRPVPFDTSKLETENLFLCLGIRNPKIVLGMPRLVHGKGGLGMRIQLLSHGWLVQAWEMVSWHMGK
ncbi:unnamed protein product [Prunus armeniaca]